MARASEVLLLEGQRSCKSLTKYIDNFANWSIVNSLFHREELLNEKLLSRFIYFIDVSPKTMLTYKISIRQFFKWLKTNWIYKPQRQDIIRYKEDLKLMGLKSTTIANYIIALKRFFQWVNSEGIYSNIAENVKSPKVDKAHKKDYLTSDQANRLLRDIDRSNLKGLRDYAMLMLMLTCGLRTIEVMRLDCRDISILGDNEILYIQGKGHQEKNEFMRITSQVSIALREYLKKAQETVKITSPLFVNLSNNKRGKRLTSYSISRIVKNRLRNVGFDSDRFTAHSLRHTSITLALLSGATMQEAQSFARHADINSTQIYAHNLEKINSRTEQMITDAILKNEHKESPMSTNTH